MQLHDLRAMQQSATITDAHSMPIRDIDFARQQDNLLATAGIDCMFRLWDLRCCLCLCNNSQSASVSVCSQVE